MRPDMQDRLSIIKYNNWINVLQPMTLVTSANQQGMVNLINSTVLAPDGSTSIAGGVMLALNELATPRSTPSTKLNKMMLVLTDGMDNTAYLNPDDGQYYSLLGGQEQADYWSNNLVNTSAISPPVDVKIYAVGLGNTDMIDVARLGVLAHSTVPI